MAEEKEIIIKIEVGIELCGSPYFVEEKFSVKELMEKGIVNAEDVREMLQGKEIHKQIPVNLGDEK